LFRGKFKTATPIYLMSAVTTREVGHTRHRVHPGGSPDNAAYPH
jgi:hypothetical protein